MPVILGIDPGSRKTGFGLIRSERGKSTYISSGIIRLPVDEPLPPATGRVVRCDQSNLRRVSAG